jgi:hypothetical protein
MNGRGSFAVNRGVFDHPIFAPEPYTEREAWIWLCGEAAWKQKRVRVGRATVNLERGQVAHATRFLAAKWRWSESRVRRFLKRLKSDAMVTLQTTREATQITICNYEKHAFRRRTGDALDDAPTDALATHWRRKEEEGNKERPKKEVHALQAAPDPSELFGEPINEPPKAKLFRKGKTLLVSLGISEKQSGSIIGHWLKAKHDPEGILAALQYAVDHGVIEPLGYVTRLLAKDTTNGKISGSDRAKQLADEARELERQARISRPPDTP